MKHGLKIFLLTAAAAIFMTASVPKSQAQISIGINIGPEPACPYGYFDYAPYSCAPYGYYGPEWFSGGVFLGAGPWFHGPAGFHGHVNNKFDPQHGYHGALPNRGDHIDPKYRAPAPAKFKGNEVREQHRADEKR